MAQITIKDAIIKVMQAENHPMTPNEIYNKIQDMGFFQFGAKNPVGMVSTVLRKHCEGSEIKKAHKEKYFRRLDNGTYLLIK